jgi:hypothetical protein
VPAICVVLLKVRKGCGRGNRVDFVIGLVEKVV